jgi:hypothetical protein
MRAPTDRPRRVPARSADHRRFASEPYPQAQRFPAAQPLRALRQRLAAPQRLAARQQLAAWQQSAAQHCSRLHVDLPRCAPTMPEEPHADLLKASKRIPARWRARSSRAWRTPVLPRATPSVSQSRARRQWEEVCRLEPRERRRRPPPFCSRQPPLVTMCFGERRSTARQQSRQWQAERPIQDAIAATSTRQLRMREPFG